MRRRATAVRCVPAAPLAVVRLRFALVGSALLHFVGVSALTPQKPPASWDAAGWPEPITVHLEPVARPVPVIETAMRPEPAKSRPGRADTGGKERIVPGTGVAADPQAAIALPVRDLTVYSARELDTLPQPVLPLEIGRLAGGGGAPPSTLVLELTIDEHGFVHDVSFGAPGASRAMERELRAAIAQTAFVPARKDGRTVKSRIMLSVSFAASRGGE